MTTRNLIARAQEKEKIRLENRLIPRLDMLFKQMAQDFKVSVALTGDIVDTTLFTEEWVSVLERHYIITGGSFIPQGLDIKKIGFDLVTKQTNNQPQAAASAAYLLWSKARATFQASIIINTTTREMNQVLEDSKVSVRKDNPDFSEEAKQNLIVETATIALLLRFRTRIPLIANVETQNPAEQAKLFGATSQAGLPVLPMQEVIVTPKKLNKIWVTVGDERVRPAHSNANNQKRKLSEAFDVGGEKLVVPGDTSLGASLGNVINCRCAAIYKQI